MAQGYIPGIVAAIATFGAIAGITLHSNSSNSVLVAEPRSLPTHSLDEPTFLVVAGGGAPSYNEIALEKKCAIFPAHPLSFGQIGGCPHHLFCQW